MHRIPRVLRGAVGGSRSRTAAYQTRRASTSGIEPRPNNIGDGIGSETAKAVQLPSCRSAPYLRRTHTCKSLSGSDVDKKVTVAGWIQPKRRATRNISCYNLKDGLGEIQLVVWGDASDPLQAMMDAIPTQSAIVAEGVLKLRHINQKRDYPNGDIEILLKSVQVINPADRNLPLMPHDIHNLANEKVRLRHRYLDLRRTELANNIRKRSEVAHLVRTILHEHDFAEVETPMLLKSSPEGAREFIVPTRLSTSAPDSTSLNDDQSPGVNTESASTPRFYALPQSPQQPKQLLVISGVVDRYYQLARCFRDEDGRKDRQPEFTQLDLEMAWVSWGESNGSRPEPEGATEPHGTWRMGGSEVRVIVETLVRRIWSRFEATELPGQFRVMTYDTAMSRYGSDKPDLRFGLEIQDITQLMSDSVRQALAERDEMVEAWILPMGSAVQFMRGARRVLLQGDSKLERIKVANDNDGTWLSRSRVLRGILGIDSEGPMDCPNVNSVLDLNDGGVVFLSRRQRKPEGGSTALGRIRIEVANMAQSMGDLGLSSEPQFLWVTEFPLFTRADADKEFLAHGRWSSTHHPFTAPMWEDIEKMYEGKIEEVRGQHYDLVLNGVEIGGGSVRVHDPAMQEHIFENILRLTDQEKATFDHLRQALRSGAPPHGGFAFGFDRLMAILCKAESIRDVIVFPKTGAGADPLFKSPAPVDPSVLAQYGIRPQRLS
ncbi:hypothetical protein WOLCODRAFT_100460 [Wolfiporia cocos MD-104 SS10]|uniref:Aminoacyl-transfer RNA synthetases class-II family profile domain-containing protein n=1 Tax=Wolfiporia cocos (strain MD-104) TaxID=742152 RepID=A0A2H3JNB1_WOLCO|nr:hypothetical protein WOLCODRAFT_100460 [Wolfiporia cocos MD-104 SS10]